MEKGNLMISEKAIKEFKELYRQRFKEKLNDEQAFEKAILLLNLYKAVYGDQQINKKQYENGKPKN